MSKVGYTSVIFLDLRVKVDGTYQGVARSKNVGWTHMASAEREPITKVWAEPVEGPPAPPGRGGLTYAQGPHVTYEKIFSSFFN